MRFSSIPLYESALLATLARNVHQKTEFFNSTRHYGALCTFPGLAPAPLKHPICFQACLGLWNAGLELKSRGNLKIRKITHFTIFINFYLPKDAPKTTSGLVVDGVPARFGAGWVRPLDVQRDPKMAALLVLFLVRCPKDNLWSWPLWGASFCTQIK